VPGPETAVPKPSLLQKVALASLIPVVVLGILLQIALENQIRERALENAVASAELISRLGIQPQLEGADLNEPFSSEEIAALDRTLRASSLRDELAQIKIWNRDAQIVYSDDHDLIGLGSDEGASEGLREALEGGTASELLGSEGGEVDEAGEEVDVGTESLLATHGPLLEVYVPLSVGLDQTPDGAFEIYLPYGQVAAAVSRDVRRDQVLLFGGLAALYVVLLPIVAGASRRLRRQAQVERAAAQRLRELDDMRNSFLAAVSHELRTPLSAILGCAITLRQAPELGVSPADARDLVGRLEANARKLNRLLSDLLDVDRLAQGVLEPRRAPTDVTALVRYVIEETETAEVGSVNVEGEPVIVNVDPAKVERIVENLIANVLRHAPGSDLWVRVSAEADGVLIVVEDDGRGVPEELRAQIFEPFRQGASIPTHAPGVGVGLSIVANFARLHGGRAWVEEREGGGASFRVFLPGEKAEIQAVAG
jgi:signal transduction histidine kinase